MTQQTHKISPALIHHCRINPKAVGYWQSLDNKTRADHYEKARADLYDDGERIDTNEVLANAVEGAYFDYRERAAAVEAEANRLLKESDDPLGFKIPPGKPGSWVQFG